MTDAVPAEAITAATKALDGWHWKDHPGDQRRDLVRVMLEAAAPHLRHRVAAEFYRDVEALMADYRDDSRDIIAAVPFAASLMQLACEKYEITL